MAQYHESNFTAANGTAVSTLTPTVGDALFTANGVTVQNNRAYGSASNSLFSQLSETNSGLRPPYAAHQVAVAFRRVSGVPSGVRILGREAAQDTATCYEVTVNGTTLELLVRAAGSPTSLGTATISTTDGGDYTAVLVMDGTDISVKWNGSTVIGPVSDSTITSLSPTPNGRYAWVYPGAGSSTTGWHVDKFEVQDVGDDAPASVADSLEYGTQPANTNVGSTMPPFTVRAVDSTQSDALDTSYTGNITVAATGTGNYTGTVTRAAIAGVATFNDIVPQTIGTGLTFTASASGLGTEVSSTFNITVPSGSGTILLGGGMQRAITDGETTASRKRLFFDIRDSAGAAWAGSVTGVKAQLSISGATAAASTNDIVRVSGASHYIELTNDERAAASPGDVIEAWVAAATGRLESTHAFAEITASDVYAAALTETAIANAVVEAEIDALETYNRTPNTAATITGPINGATTLTSVTDAAYEPIKSIS